MRCAGSWTWSCCPSYAVAEPPASELTTCVDRSTSSQMTVSYMLSFIDKVALSNASILGIREGDVRRRPVIGMLTQRHRRLIWPAAPPGAAVQLGVGDFLLWVSHSTVPKLHLDAKDATGEVLWDYDYAMGWPSQSPYSADKLLTGRQGLTTTSISATNSFATLATARFFLGVFESCLAPILTLLVGQYWTRQEQALRACIWWAGGPLGGFTLDGIAYAVSGSGFPSSKYADWQVTVIPHRHPISVH